MNTRKTLFFDQYTIYLYICLLRYIYSIFFIFFVTFFKVLIFMEISQRIVMVKIMLSYVLRTDQRVAIIIIPWIHFLRATLRLVSTESCTCTDYIYYFMHLCLQFYLFLNIHLFNLLLFFFLFILSRLLNSFWFIYLLI